MTATVVRGLSPREVWALLEDPGYGYVRFRESGSRVFIGGRRLDALGDCVGAEQEYRLWADGRLMRFRSWLVATDGPLSQRWVSSPDGPRLDAAIEVADHPDGAVIRRTAYRTLSTSGPDLSDDHVRHCLARESKAMLAIWTRNIESLDWLRRGPVCF